MLAPSLADSVADPDNPGCTDCVKTAYDVGGRMTGRTDQRGLVTTMTYDKRSLLLTRTTGTDKDTFDYDALGRLRLAKRGTTTNDDAVSSSVMAYNDLGDLDYEDQTIAEGTVRRTDYGYDQAGNRKSLAYPGGTAVAYTPTDLNQVATITRNGSPLVAYTYAGGGHPMQNRRVTTAEAGGTTHYDHTLTYNTFRQIRTITNSLTTSAKATQTVAEYTFTRDGNGNPLTQTAEGQPDFAVDDRTFSVDRLNRLTGTNYAETSNSESAVLDLQGNRESHVGRDGTARSYTLGNAANEYATVDPDGSGGSPAAPVGYDAAGNLSVDEAGREYEYDEHNRLTGVIASDGTTVLAEYAYDALGRRIRSSILATAGSPPVVTRYYHDGSRMIEERDGSDARRRYHVNGGQYIDEHVETFKDDAGRAGEVTYYLANLDYSVAGTGNADGTVIERLDYTSGGDFVEGEPPGPCVRGDVNGDGRIDGRDAQTFINVLLGQDTNAVHICAADIDVSGGVNLTDAPLFVECLLAGGCPAEVECTRADVNDDGHVDGRDAQTFINVLLGLDTNAVHTCAADINDSGTVNLTDVPLFVQCLLAGGCGGGQPLCRRGDVNNDGLVTIADVGPFVSVLLAGTGTAQQVCAADLGGPAYTIPGTPDGLIDGNDIQAFLDCLLGGQCPPAPAGFAGMLLDGDIGSVDPPVGDVGWMGDLAWMGERKVVPLTPWVADDAALQPRSGRALPAPGTFAMHGCPIDVLLDGLVLQYNRARYYDVKNGRWLQRDPAGYVDGANLYESFRSNPTLNVDPSGKFGPAALVFALGIYLLWPPDPAVAPTGSPGEEEMLARLNQEIAVERSVFLVTVVLFPVGGALGEGLAPTVGTWTSRTVGSELAGSVAAYGTECLAIGTVVTAGQEATYAGWVAQTQGWEAVPGLYNKPGDFGRIGLGLSLNTGVPAVFGMGSLAARPSMGMVEVEGQRYLAVAAGREVSASEAARLTGPTGNVALRRFTPETGEQMWLPFMERGSALTQLAPQAWMVGPYGEIKSLAGATLQAHHVGQKAVMARFIPEYNPETAPSILVPKVGHTIRDLERGIVSRSTSGFSNVREVVARDIQELRRVYPDVPNSQLKLLIERNKQQYPVIGLRKMP
jgi:RHS repeat-associated protein